MGRSTPSLRAVVREYVERLRRIAQVLPPDERELVERYLEDIEGTLSACMHVGVVDPIEVLVLHLVRRVGGLCGRCG